MMEPTVFVEEMGMDRKQMRSEGTKGTKRNIYLFIPNIICYIRFFILAIPLSFATTRPLLTALSYFISAELDIVDGIVARKLNQQSKLGVLLDFSIDRMSLVVAISILIHLYSSHWYYFCILLFLDVGSHFVQLYSTVFSDHSHHKKLISNPVLKMYYSEKRLFMGWCCTSHDFFLGFIYLHYFYQPTWLWVWFAITLPGFIMKTIVHVFQIIQGMQSAVRIEVESSSGLA